ncbi:MAG: hypothetical protein Ct9H300mP11_33410 [Chloroflexota bacterium]|nr:MAG: hypothetical protein Ct9H300mP11_33410 [Chloroflexota bacterium]
MAKATRRKRLNDMTSGEIITDKVTMEVPSPVEGSWYVC